MRLPKFLLDCYQVSAVHFYLKQHEIMAQVEAWIVEMESFPETSRRSSRGLPHNIAALKVASYCCLYGDKYIM